MQVSALAAACFDDEIIARHVGISLPTLRKHYKDEIENTLAKANAMVAASLLKNIKNGSLGAALFLLQHHSGWDEEPESLEPFDPPLTSLTQRYDSRGRSRFPQP